VHDGTNLRTLGVDLQSGKNEPVGCKALRKKEEFYSWIYLTRNNLEPNTYIEVEMCSVRFTRTMSSDIETGANDGIGLRI
jgi:hypothetical protein